MLYGLHGFSRTGLGFRFSLLNPKIMFTTHVTIHVNTDRVDHVGSVAHGVCHFLGAVFRLLGLLPCRFLVDWTAETPAGYLVRQIRILYSIGYRTKKDQNIQSILIFYYCYLCISNVLVFLLTVPSQWYLLPVYCIMYISLTLSPSIFLLSNWISFLPLL